MTFLRTRMTPTLAGGLIAFALVVSIAAYFYFQEWRIYELPGFMSDRALANPHLAMQTYLEKRGVSFSTESDVFARDLLDAMGQHTAIYLPVKPGTLKAGHSEKLLEWVLLGGTLLYRPNLRFDPNARRPNDPILEEIGARYTHKRNRTLRNLSIKRKSYVDGCTDDPAALTSVNLNDSTLQTDLSQYAFYSRKNVPITATAKVLPISHGAGTVILIPSDFQWENAYFLCHDNAKLLFELIQLNAGPTKQRIKQFVWLEPGEYLWLTDRLLRDYSLPILFLFTMLALWIWKSMLRHQQVFPPEASNARPLRDYLVTLATFHWKGGRGQDLLEHQREGFKRNLASATPEKVVAELAKPKDFNQAEIERAMFSDPGMNKREFLAIQKTLNKLR